MKLKRKLSRKPNPLFNQLRPGMRLVGNHRDRYAPMIEVRTVDPASRRVLVAAFGKGGHGVMKVISEATLNRYCLPARSPWGVGR